MDTNPTNRKYWAFISYSHRDSQMANWLHKKLETYKVPKSLIGTSQRNGVVPRRIFPVFRDRDELPTSSDLGENIRQALSNSRYLIVIASPDSAASKWVNEEVSWFKRVHRNSNILVLIAKGEPNATDRGAPENECFCPGLRYQVTEAGEIGTETSEPIAADMRSSGDGESRAFLKIVAGILGVSFDDLYKREARRRRTRMLLGAVAGSVAAIALFAILSNLQRVKTEQAAMSSKQKEIQDVVSSMKESGPYKEIGKLPKARREALEKAIKDSGIESFLASMPQNIKNDLKQENELLQPLQHITSKAGASEIVEKNPHERDFMKQLNLWLEAIEKEQKLFEESKAPDLNSKWNKYFTEFERKYGTIWKFEKNLEEKLVIQDLYADLQSRMFSFQERYMGGGSDRYSSMEKVFKSAAESIQDPKHPFSADRFKERIESGLGIKREAFVRKMEQVKKAVMEYGDYPLDELSDRFDATIRIVEEFMKDQEIIKNDYHEMEANAYPSGSLYSYSLPDYHRVVSDICEKERKFIQDLLKELKEVAKKTDEKVKTRIKESGKDINVGNIRDYIY